MTYYVPFHPVPNQENYFSSLFTITIIKALEIGHWAEWNHLIIKKEKKIQENNTEK